MSSCQPFLSFQLELPFLRKAHHKMAALRRSIVDTDRRATISGPLDLTFIEEAVRELLAARRVLIASYGFGYYLKGRNLVYRFENDQVHVCVHVLIGLRCTVWSTCEL